MIADWWMGARADRAAKLLGRVGLRVALLTLVSVLAFLFMPRVASAGNPRPFLAVTLVWVVTSSALRAPPLALPAFLAAVALAALGFQVHFALNSAPDYLRFAQPADLERLMPVFWIGFNLAMPPLGWLIRRWGEFRMLAAGARCWARWPCSPRPSRVRSICWWARSWSPAPPGAR